jgi:branched-chain amino acid transport system permease protein
MTRSGWPFFPAMIAGGIAMLLYGALVGLPVLRLRGHYFAIATLGVAIATRELCNNLAIFGASQPVNLPLKNAPKLFYYVALGLLVIAIIMTYLIARSKLGYGLAAIRENEDAALVMGINTTLYKVVAFSLNAMLCGLAGGVYAYWHSTIDPPTVFDLTTNVRLIVMAVLGGAGTPLGPILGAAVLTGIQETLWKNFTNLHAVLFGASIVVVVMLMPRGIVYLIRQKFSWRVFARNLRQYRV